MFGITFYMLSVDQAFRESIYLYRLHLSLKIATLAGSTVCSYSHFIFYIQCNGRDNDL